MIFYWVYWVEDSSIGKFLLLRWKVFAYTYMNIYTHLFASYTNESIIFDWLIIDLRSLKCNLDSWIDVKNICISITLVPNVFFHMVIVILFMMKLLPFWFWLLHALAMLIKTVTYLIVVCYRSYNMYKFMEYSRDRAINASRKLNCT